MRLAVVGVGGLGGYFGARLAQADSDVHFLARGRHLEALRTHGLRIQSVFGDFALAPEQVPATGDEVIVEGGVVRRLDPRGKV